MTDSRQSLSRLNRVLQLNLFWIRSALRAAAGPDFTALLRDFLRELEAIEAEARHTACQRGWELSQPSPALCFWHSRRFHRKDSNASIAEQLILLCIKTRVQMVRESNRDIRGYAVSSLYLKLTDFYAVILRQLERFL